MNTSVADNNMPSRHYIEITIIFIIFKTLESDLLIGISTATH